METLTVNLLQSRRLRLMIIAAAILLSAFLAYAGFQNQLTILVLLLLAGAAVVLTLLRWPSLGVVALIASSLTVTYSIGTGTGTRLNAPVLVLILLLGLWVFHLIAYERSIRIFPSRTVLPIIAFAVVIILAFINGQLPWLNFAGKASIAAQLGGTALFFLSLGAYLLVGNQVRDIRWLEIITWLFLIISAAYIVWAIIPGLGTLSSVVFSEGLTAGSLFWVWLAALAFSQAVFNHRLHPVVRLALAGLLVGVFFISFVRNRDWSSGWLPSVVAIVFILMVSRSRWFWLALLVGVFMASFKVQSVIDLLFTPDNQYSYMTRLAAWRIMAEIIKINPILGLGPANYYWYTPLFPILGYAVQFNSHNNYIDIIAQVGLLGLACFLWFVWEVWRLGLRLRNTVPEGFPRAYVYGALGGLAGTLFAGMLGDWFLPFIYNVSYDGFRASVLAWVFLGGLMALEGMSWGTNKAVEGEDI